MCGFGGSRMPQLPDPPKPRLVQPQVAAPQRVSESVLDKRAKDKNAARRRYVANQTRNQDPGVFESTSSGLIGR